MCSAVVWNILISRNSRLDHDDESDFAKNEIESEQENLLEEEELDERTRLTEGYFLNLAENQSQAHQ